MLQTTRGVFAIWSPSRWVFIRQIYSAAANWWPGVATSPPHVKPSKSDHLITSLAEVSMTFILYVQSGNYYTWTRGSEWTIFFSSGNVAEVITAIYSSETLILQIFVPRIISDLIAPSSSIFPLNTCKSIIYLFLMQLVWKITGNIINLI